MKTCNKCGFTNTDDCLFCEKCGQSLAAPQKKKPKFIWFLIPLVCIIVGLIITAAVLLFVFRDKLPFIGKKKAQAETSISEEIQENTKLDEEESKALQEEEAAKPESGQEQAGADNEDGRPEPEKDEKEDKTVDIDGVDQAYVEVVGTLVERDGSLGVQMPKPSSVCAYDDENEIVQAKDVSYLRIDNDDLEEYIGAEVSIKGKLFARNDRQFMLEVVKLDVQKEADREEGAESGTDAVSGQGTDSDNHHYSLIVADVTWQEAFDDCISRGGYLAQINSEEEYQAVIEMIEAENKQNIHFYLGGRRDIDSREYYWVDKDNELSGELLNPQGNSWASPHWMENEPSFTSEEDQEMYMNMIYYQDNWVLNDVPMDITEYYPGKTGYICEFDE